MSGYQTRFVIAVTNHPYGSYSRITTVRCFDSTMNNKDQALLSFIGSDDFMVPPLSTPLRPWAYDREMYKRRNEVERLTRRLKGFRRMFSRFENLDVLFLGFISFALILDALR